MFDRHVSRGTGKTDDPEGDPMKTITQRWKLLALFALAAILVLSACGGDDDDATASFADDASASDDGAEAVAAFAEEEPADEPAAAPEPAPASDDDADRGFLSDDAPTAAAESDEGGGGDTGGDPQSDQTPRTQTNRSVIFIASVEVVVEDVNLSASMAKAQIASLGGLVFGENTQVGRTSSTTLEFKVLPEDFDEALRRLEGLGKRVSQTITTDDVTERVVDLQSRITTASASVDRLRTFLEGATDLKDIAELELQLLQRETDLEVLRGQLRTIQDQVALATIFLTLSETAAPEVEPLGEYTVSFYDGDDDGDGCPGASEFSVDESDDFTVCVEIVNVGANAMTDIVVRDNPLDLDPRDFAFIDFESGVLEPGATVFAYGSTTAPAVGRSNVKLTASAADVNGESLRIAIEFFQPDEADVRFVKDDSLPGFLDALGGSWDVLTQIVRVAILAFAGIIPFLFLIPLAWFVRRWWLRSQADRYDDHEQMVAEGAARVPAAPSDSTDD
jgi:hypothetical protein